MSGKNRLVLGTAQLGMRYGIANTAGKPDFETAQRILEVAWKNGIRQFDTAQAYGDSEEILGHVFKSLGISQKARIISKPHPNLDHLDPGTMKQALHQTLNKLNTKNLFCYMLHSEELLDLWDHGLQEILKGFLREGLTRHIGIALYSPERAMQALETEDISVIQIPTNILDSRFQRSGVGALAKDLGKKVYIRSVFLQGLLLMKNDQVPENLQFASTVVKKLNTYANQLSLSPTALALGYVKVTEPDAQIIFGAETPGQVEKNVSIWKHGFSLDMFDALPSVLGTIDDRIVDPTQWVS